MLNTALSSQMLKSLVSRGSVFAPTLAGSFAFRLFCNPRIAQDLTSDERAMEVAAREQLAQAKPFRVSSGSHEIQAYHFPTRNHSGTIILVHGWTSEASHLMALVAPLLAQNFSVVAFDLPAHGKSTGWTTNLIECANALQEIASLFSNVHGIVAHSFGGPVTALALAGLSADELAFDVGKIALLAAPNESAYVTRRFGDELGLGPQAQSDFEAAFEAACNCSITNFTGSKFFARINRPMLVLHGENDFDVPVDHGEHYGELTDCQFISFKNLGHRDILYAPSVSDHVARFMAG